MKKTSKLYPDWEFYNPLKYSQDKYPRFILLKCPNVRIELKIKQLKSQDRILNRFRL